MLLLASRPEAPRVEVQERVWPIAVTQVSPQTARPTLTLYGRIEAPDQVHAAAPINGRILRVSVRDGDRVDAGALLVQFDPRDLEPRLERARAEDRKSTRLNSSHVRISYAVFCLKKKKTTETPAHPDPPH